MIPILCEGVEMIDAFRFKTPCSILIVGPSACGKTCFSKSLILDHLDKLFVNPPTVIHYCYGAWQDGFREIYETFPSSQYHRHLFVSRHLSTWQIC